MPIVQVRRQGTARILRAGIDGVALEWMRESPNDTRRSISKPKNLPSGRRVLRWYAEGKSGTTYQFAIIQPTGTPCFIGPHTFAADGSNYGDCEFDL